MQYHNLYLARNEITMCTSNSQMYRRKTLKKTQFIKDPHFALTAVTCTQNSYQHVNLANHTLHRGSDTTTVKLSLRQKLAVTNEINAGFVVME